MLLFHVPEVWPSDSHNLQVLLLAWKMGAQQMGFFSKSEFEQGLQAYK